MINSSPNDHDPIQQFCLNRLGYFFVVGLKLLGNLGDRANVDLTLKQAKVRDSAPAVRLTLNRKCHCSLITLVLPVMSLAVPSVVEIMPRLLPHDEMRKAVHTGFVES